MKGTVTTSVLSTCEMFVECADDPYVLENLQKCFVRIKTAKKKIVTISHENRAKNGKRKKSNNIQKRKN